MRSRRGWVVAVLLMGLATSGFSVPDAPSQPAVGPADLLAVHLAEALTDIGPITPIWRGSGIDGCSAELSTTCEDPVCAIGPGSPAGQRSMVSGTRGSTGVGRVYTVSVEVEVGIDVDPSCFADAVEQILWDGRSWSGSKRVSFERIDTTGADIRIILASPRLTDRLCAPLRTGGDLSCRRGDRVIINAKRWERGIRGYAGDLRQYQAYLINHEVGHLLGKGHQLCPGKGEPAPIMMQQSKGLRGCTPNGWPLTPDK